MFVLIMMSICCRGLGTDVKDTQSQTKAYKAKLTIAAILAVMFGLGWTLGLAATSVPVKEFSLTFQILFSIFVGAQGVLIFLLHGVRNQDVRKLWKKWFTMLGSKSRLSTILSSFPGSEAGRTGGGSTYLLTLPRKKPTSTPAAVYFNKQAVAESNMYESVALKVSSEGKNNKDDEPQYHTIDDSTDLSTSPCKKDASVPATIYFNKQVATESNLYESIAVEICFKDEEESLNEKDELDEKLQCEFMDVGDKENA